MDVGALFVLFDFTTDMGLEIAIRLARNEAKTSIKKEQIKHF